MNAKYTPGPWHIGVRTAHSKRDIYGPKGESVAITDDVATDPIEARANARLIAEAPAMVEALGAALHCLETPGDFTAEERRHVIEDCAAILARIEGSGLPPRSAP